MQIEHKIQHLLDVAAFPNGFVASPLLADNYQRVWSRDSAILALALLVDERDQYYPIIEKGILALGKQQSETGAIPSNISAQDNGDKASFGSLVGRIDATTWWLIQTFLFVKATGRNELLEELHVPIDKAFQCLRTWELNERHLIYTPLGGNWADEYHQSGYTLYDNLLYYWALRLASENNWSEAIIDKKEQVKKSIIANFSLEQNDSEYTIHSRARKEQFTDDCKHWPMSFAPNGYDFTFDLAAHALLGLLGFSKEMGKSYALSVAKKNGHFLLPAFHPTVYPGDKKWELLHHNNSYQFKNHPNQFHNGGAWPVMFGWYGMALTLCGHGKYSKQIFDNYASFLRQQKEPAFDEYIDPTNQKVGGVHELCFSVAGYLFLKNANESPSKLNLFAAK